MNRALKILKPYICFFLLALLSGGWLAGCSAGRHNPLGRLYQNITARYNAYYLGNERLKTLEAEVIAKTPVDYNRLLPIFPVIDSAAASGMRKELDEIIKKASYPIRKRPSSDWTDDSYLLIGKARYYGREFDEAIKTFKYINSTSKKEETRHEALVWLMRCFVTIEDLESAKAVSDVMKKQFLNRENARLLFLIRAQYHLLRQELPLSIENLRLAIPLIDQKDEAARIRFILAQLYQQTNQPKLAYRQFMQILRKNPPYELGLQSKLHLSQVTELSNTADLEKIDKYFTKLQKDIKNKEYLDKIYYERARFELKQNKPAQALKNLQLSVRASTTNRAQKGYSYLLAGQIYYDRMQKYRMARAYYDSAVQVLPPTAAEYAAAAERRDILNDFADNLEIIQREDSLLVLAQLPQPELEKRIDEILTRQQEQQAAEAQKAAAAASTRGSASPTGTNNMGMATGNNAAGTSNTQQSGGVWYFDNPVTVASARTEFIRRWGNRRLQDNWRTSNQQASEGPQDLAQQNTLTPAASAAQSADQQKAARTRLLQEVPSSPQQKEAAEKRLETAYFNLATIYRLQLKEPARAIETYETLLKRFPRTEHAAEVYYTLYLLYREANDPKQNQYAGLLRQQYPTSRYARLIDQPDYLVRVSAGNQQARNLYDKAFTLFEDHQYAEAAQVLDNIRQQYPESELNDKVAFLNARIIGYTQRPAQFKAALEQFLVQHPDSPLTEKARQYLAAIALHKSGKLTGTTTNQTQSQQSATTARLPEQGQVPPTTQPANASPATQSAPPINQLPADTNSQAGNMAATSYATPDMKTPHLVLLVYPEGQAAFANMAQKMQEYNTTQYAAEKLSAEEMNFNKTQDLIIIGQFSDRAKAMSYVSKQKAPPSPLSKIRGIEFVTFVISEENLPVLLQKGKLEEYLKFYKNNY